MGTRRSQKKFLTKINTELEKHEEYLQSMNKKIYLVVPDNNCLFRALAHSAKLPGPGYVSLRTDVVDYMKSNITKFLQFTYLEGEEATSMEDFREELDDISEDDIWVNYESVMAASLVLRRSILVTSGGYGHETMKTNSYYYSRKAPLDKYAHIGYISLGFYYSIMDLGSPDSKIDVEDWLMQQGSTVNPFNGRKPSHMCDCDGACACREYETPWIFKKSGGCHGKKKSSNRKKASPTCDCEGTCACGKSPTKIERKEVMDTAASSLCTSRHVIEQRTMLFCKLHLSGVHMADVKAITRPSEQLLEGLNAWVQEEGASKSNTMQTLGTLESALRSMRLNLAADNMKQAVWETHKIDL